MLRLRPSVSQLSLSSIVKAQLLSLGCRIDMGAISGLGETLKENNFGYDDPNWLPSDIANLYIPSAIILPGNIVAAVRYRPKSPLVISRGENGLILRQNSQIFSIKIPQRPKFWSCRTKQGVEMKRIGSVCGTSALYFFIHNCCEFWRFRRQCKFCSLKPTFERHKSVELKKEIDQVVETVEASLKMSEIRYINFVGGSMINHDREVERYIAYVSAVREAIRKNKVEGYVITMPPHDFALIDKLSEAGITNVKFNLEVFDAGLFKTICPGKARYGREKIIAALEYATGVFGEGHVFTNLIIGLEHPTSLLEGFETLTSRGIVPEAVVFHPDPETDLQHIQPPRTREAMNIYRTLGEILRQAGLKPPMDIKNLRNSLSWEAYYGYLQN